jgi:uncharacterized protein YigA (DUF484 family)
VSTPPMDDGPLQGITEQDIADYLANTPDFFERQAELLASVRLASPHGHRAVSLQERQMDMLRERIKGLEHKIIEMIRNGQENVAIADRLHRWTRALLLTPEPAELPSRLLQALRHEFLIPMAAMRLWAVDAALADSDAAAAYTVGVDDDVRRFAQALVTPYCGAPTDREVAQWLGDAASVASVAMIPLRHGGASAEDGGTFGLLVLGSPDPTRYAADMGTEFLMRVGDIASAALSRLRTAPGPEAGPDTPAAED